MALGHVLYIFLEEGKGGLVALCAGLWGPLWPLLRRTYLFTSIKLERQFKMQIPSFFFWMFWFRETGVKLRTRILNKSPREFWYCLTLGNTSIAPPVSYQTLNFLLSCEIGKPHDLPSHTEVDAHSLVSSSSLFIMKHVGAEDIRHPW